MTKYFKSIWVLIGFLAIIFSACKKNELPSTALTLPSLVHKIIGVYSVTQYCSHGSGASGYTYDTSYNFQLVISTSDDSSIILNGRQLSFSGDLILKQYGFYSSSSGGGYNAQFDSSCHSILFGIHDGGLGGGSSCSGSGSK